MAATRTDILSSIFCKLIQRLIGVVHNASSRQSVHACSTQGRLRVGFQNSESKWRESVFSSVCFSLLFTIFFFMQRKAKFPRHKVCSPDQGCLRFQELASS